MTEVSEKQVKSTIEGYMKRADNIIKSFCRKGVEPQELMLFLAFVQISGALALANANPDATTEGMIDATHELAQTVLKDLSEQASKNN